MLKRIFLVAAALAVILAGAPANALLLCDTNGIVYDIKLSNGEFIFGTASNLPCGGSAPLVGSFTRVTDGWFFSIFVDQNPLNPKCCEGFEILGLWRNRAGSGNWYESREEIACSNTGTFALGRCSTPLRSEPYLQQPGTKF